jgi:hypothetical protein
MNWAKFLSKRIGLMCSAKLPEVLSPFGDEQELSSDG